MPEEIAPLPEAPTEFIETVRKEKGIKIKRPFTVPELRSILDLANDEWRQSFTSNSAQASDLETFATLRWNNLVARGELRLSTRKTGKAIVLPLAPSLRKQIECLLTSSNGPFAPIHPKATRYLGLTMTQDYENGKGGISAVDVGPDVEFAFLVEPFD